MASVGQGYAIFVGVEVSGDAEVAAVVAAGEAEGGLWVGGGAAADDHGADRTAEEKAGDGGGGSAGGGLTCEEIAGTGKADTCGV